MVCAVTRMINLVCRRSRRDILEKMFWLFFSIIVSIFVQRYHFFLGGNEIFRLFSLRVQIFALPLQCQNLIAVQPLTESQPFLYLHIIYII